MGIVIVVSAPHYSRAPLANRTEGHDWSEELKSGDNESIDIPGLSIDIPDTGISAGLVLDYDFTLKHSGKDEMLGLSFALDVCASIPVVGQECGGDIPGIDHVFPINIISDCEFDIGAFCNGANHDGPVVRGRLIGNGKDKKVGPAIEV